MDIEQILGRRDGPVPRTWVLAARVAAGVAFVCVATSDWVPRAMRVLSGLEGLGPLVVLSPLLSLAAWVVSGVAAAAVVLLGVRRPGLATGLALVPLAPAVLLGTPLPFATVAVLAGVTVAAAWRHPRSAVTATGAALATVLVWVVLQVPMLAPLGGYVELQYTDGAGVAVAYVVVLLGVLAAALAGRTLLGESLDQGRRLAVRSAEVEEQSEVTAERARLARDLHDVVAHHVSLIAVRAETAPYTHPGLGTEARSVLAEIAADARRALDELRGVLGILGRSVGEARSPQPSWGDIAALVERSSSSGQPVDLAGDVQAEVGPAVGYVAYRVVQEGLTNARKHAAGAPVSVRLERTEHLAVVSVVSVLSEGDAPGSADVPSVTTGTGSSEETAPIVGLPARAGTVPRTADPAGSTRALPVAGHGLVGMRERVEALGGRLVAGARDGGFVVEATLPLVHEERR